MKPLDELLADPNNQNPLFLRVLTLATRHHAHLTKKILSARVNIASLVGGSSIADVLDREPDIRKIQKSKSVTKWMLGSSFGNIEVWSSPSGNKYLMITNGLSRRNKRFKVYEVIPVKKINGLWVEWKESISA